MLSTKHMKLEFKEVTHAQYQKEPYRDTQGDREKRYIVIKIMQQGTEEGVSTGCRKVNYSDQKVKEAYRRINKMLGGD